MDEKEQWKIDLEKEMENSNFRQNSDEKSAQFNELNKE